MRLVLVPPRLLYIEVTSPTSFSLKDATFHMTERPPSTDLLNKTLYVLPTPKGSLRISPPDRKYLP